MARNREREEEYIRRNAITAGGGGGGGKAAWVEERKGRLLRANSPLTLIEGSIVK